MNKREELLQDYIRLSRISFHNNVAFAYTKYEVDWKKTAFTMWLGHVHGKPVHFYMMSFDYDGITFMCYENLKFIEEVYFFDYQSVTDFKTKKKGAELKMSFMYNGNKIEFMLQRYAVGSPWIKEYMHYLEENHFFYD